MFGRFLKFPKVILVGFVLLFAIGFPLQGKSLGAANGTNQDRNLSEGLTPTHPHEKKVTSSGGYAHLSSKARNQGRIRIIVQVAVPFTPESLLSDQEGPKQRSAISNRQGKILDDLKRSGKTIVDHHAFKYSPHLSMTVDAETLNDLLESSDVENLQEDIPVPPTLDLSVPRIGATTMHTSGLTGSGVALAILDTGVDKNHPFLTNSVVSEACYSSNEPYYGSSSLCPGGVTDSTAIGSAMPYGGNCPSGECSHGTHVAGIAAGNSGVGGSPGPGLAPGAGIIAIQVFSRFDSEYYCGAGGSPCILSWTSDFMKGLQRVYDLRGDFTIASSNLSLGGGGYSSNCDSHSAKPIIDTLRAAGIATIISSGNNNYCGSISAPACISSAISVGATTDSDQVDWYSNSASFMSLLAPGSFINSSVPGGGYSSWSGTSMAAPHVTGAWALMKQDNPTATVTDLLNSFTSTGLNITDSSCSSVTKKRINVYQAYQTLKVVTPTFSQPTGTYIETVTVSLSCSTSGATIRYTTDGSDPTSSSTQYNGPLTFTTTATLKARAFKNGMADSDTAGATYTVKVAAPTFSQPTGTYIETVTVSLSSTTSGATIRYTTDGSDPTSSSTQYSSPLIFTTTAALKARAFKNGMADSDLAGATYTVKVATPTFSQPTGTYIETVTVSLSSTTSGATIRYTTDGSDPTSSSTQYSGPLTFSSTATLKARAFKSGMIDSNVASATYTVLPTYQVTPSIGFGTGQGTITPDTAQTVPQGSTTSFTVSPAAGYTASVGGTCGGTLIVDIYTTDPITANCTVIAGFTSSASCQNQPVRIVRTNTSYTTLQEAYNAAWDQDTIQAQALTLTQNLTVDRDISVSLKGGYPCNYGSNTGSLTTLKGWIKTVSGGGALTIGSFKVKPDIRPPTVTTGSATNITSNSATINGTVKPNSAETAYYFEKGTTTAYGTRNPLTSASAGHGTSDVPVSGNLTGLTPNTLYHYRLVAENSEGATNGLDDTFTTPCEFTVSPIMGYLISSSQGYSGNVTAAGGCGWTAVSNAGWISIDSGASGMGSGAVQYSVTINPTKDSRSGTMTIAGQTVTVEQAGTPCSYALNPTDQSVIAWGGTGSVTVTAVGGCTWSGVGNVNWITITSGGSGAGNGTINFNVSANSGAGSRSGTMTIAGMTFTVNQAAGPLSCGGWPVRNWNTSVTYATLQEAYNAASNGHTLQAQGIPITGNLTVNRNISITLEGGYSCDYGAFAGVNTILNGWIKTTSGGGKLTLKNFELGQ